MSRPFERGSVVRCNVDYELPTFVVNDKDHGPIGMLVMFAEGRWEAYLGVSLAARSIGLAPSCELATAEVFRVHDAEMAVTIALARGKLGRWIP